MRTALVAGGLVALSVFVATPSAAQGLGVGGRMSLVRGDVQADTSAERFFGGQVRLPLSPRTTLEVSLDRRSDSNDALTERVVETPIQGSLLLYPVRSVLSPYLLGGVGWYSQRVEQLSAGVMTTSESSRRFGYHAGLGAEIKLGRHVGVHADYRYTFLKFGSDDDDEGSLTSRFKPSYEGSMWTAGMTLYF
jgi:opacity protein-like surface antigen